MAFHWFRSFLQFACVLGHAAAFSCAAPALAEDRAEAPPDRGAMRELELRRDLDAPYPSLALSGDLVGAFFGRYALSSEFALAPAHSLVFAASWGDVLSTRAVSLRAGYHLWPEGRGLRGLFVGATGAFSIHDRASPHALGAGAEGGYALYLGGVHIAASASAERVVPFSGSAATAYGAALRIGYAWM